MISIGIAGTLFMYRAAGICISNDRVLLCRSPELPFWYLPGGRVHTGESSQDALRRELLEEIGVEPVIDRLVYVIENFFDFGEQHLQEIGLYFAISLPESSEPLGWTAPVTRTETGDGQPLEWDWHPLATIDSLDIRPPYFKHHLASLPETPVHLIERRTV